MVGTTSSGEWGAVIVAEVSPVPFVRVVLIWRGSDQDRSSRTGRDRLLGHEMSYMVIVLVKQ